MSEFDGQVAIITGGGGGIGKAAAARLLDEGASVAVQAGFGKECARSAGDGLAGRDDADA